MKAWKRNGYCAKCGNEKNLTRHHIFPKVHFGSGPRVILCRHHHQVLENLLFIMEGSTGKPERVKKCREFYYDILCDFIDKPFKIIRR